MKTQQRYWNGEPSKVFRRNLPDSPLTSCVMCLGSLFVSQPVSTFGFWSTDLRLSWPPLPRKPTYAVSVYPKETCVKKKTCHGPFRSIDPEVQTDLKSPLPAHAATLRIVG
ncbi:uncharacterized protein LY79DRAFT_250933 [Colletotrichum navitas]|uniref:Uncharacterized protein n=1 Tax=Colletotrichum navitas TaxID=681940 RepID=A0AAD8QAV4_9PEZI|nr:uncharacterized protein LY79DRAFT_250933 [Colletotrichum navitas]KAK1598646.1 hypothetical protein LY79DRAFT_250933 [Colletotrichum navitas]